MSIQKYLDKIKDAVFGKDIREAIYNSIKQCYDDASVNNDNANMEVKFARGSHPTLNDRLTEINEQLDSTVNINGVGEVKWANIAQDARENISGDKVAIVGIDSVGTINVIDNSITTRKRTQNGNFGYISCLSKAIEINTINRTITIPNASFINYGGVQGEPLSENTYSWDNGIGCFIYYDTSHHTIILQLNGEPQEHWLLLGSIINNGLVWLNCNNYTVDGESLTLKNDSVKTKHLSDNSITSSKRTVIGNSALISCLSEPIKITINNLETQIDIIIPDSVYITCGKDSGRAILKGTYTANLGFPGCFVYFNTKESTIKMILGEAPNEEDVLIGIILYNGNVDFNCNNYEINYIKDKVDFTVQVEYNNAKYTDNGCLWLPKNYKQKGEKTRLVIFCHGSGEYINPEVRDLPNPFQYLLKMGYAVLGMNGIPVQISGDGNGRHFNAPFAVDSYTKGYHYVINNFNIHKDVFITGMSLGGMMANQLVQSGTIPVIATGLFCPVIDYFKQAWCRPWQTGQRQFIAKYFLMNNYDSFNFTSSGVPTSEEIQYFKDNVDKIIGYNPMIKNEMYWDDTYYQYPHSSENTDYLKLRKTYPVPIKIWHNLDDGTVLPIYSDYFIKSVKKAGGIAELKNFKTGGHNAWDNGENRNLTDIDGSEFTLKESGYELIKWFKRFDK